MAKWDRTSGFTFHYGNYGEIVPRPSSPRSSKGGQAVKVLNIRPVGEPDKVAEAESRIAEDLKAVEELKGKLKRLGELHSRMKFMLEEIGEVIKR